MHEPGISFHDRSFCFTGKMAELKRTQAEREARARGAQTCKIVNERLDYLVVGSIPSTGWKFGEYGTKIAKARALAVRNPRASPDDLLVRLHRAGLLEQLSVAGDSAFQDRRRDGARDDHGDVASWTFQWLANEPDQTTEDSRR